MHCHSLPSLNVYFKRVHKWICDPKINNIGRVRTSSLSIGCKSIALASRKQGDQQRSESDDSTLDVEIFSLDGGWNVEALNFSDADSLLDSFEMLESEEDPVNDDVASVDLLRSIPPHLRKHLEVLQAEADDENAKLKPAEKKKAVARLKTHKKLRIISGTAAGKRIFSPQGDQTRPMMEVVRGAVFDMIASMNGGMFFGKDGRWLDLFAGTGAVGIEALSRGCLEGHFVELSPWVINNCLSPNLCDCDVVDRAIVHSGKAEDFLKRSIKIGGKFAGGSFDFISVCPPYEAVSYSEVFSLLTESPLLTPQSIVIVEYPLKCISEIRPTLGPLIKLRDRRYGRTFVAIYGPSDEEQ